MGYFIDIVQHFVVKTDITLLIVMAILHKWVIIRYSSGISGIPISILINPPGEMPKMTPKSTLRTCPVLFKSRLPLCQSLNTKRYNI